IFDNRMRECAHPVLMIFDNRMGQWCMGRSPRPVGTRGGCGEGRGPGACPCCHAILLEVHAMPKGLSPDEDKHQAPSSTQPHPLSLQDGATSFPHSVVKIHQETTLAPQLPQRSKFLDNAWQDFEQ